jgi:hypothetical protein
MQVSDYPNKEGEVKSVVITGIETKNHIEALKGLKCKFSSKLTINGQTASGWICAKTREDEVLAFVNKQNKKAGHKEITIQKAGATKKIYSINELEKMTDFQVINYLQDKATDDLRANQLLMLLSLAKRKQLDPRLTSIVRSELFGVNMLLTDREVTAMLGEFTFAQTGHLQRLSATIVVTALNMEENDNELEFIQTLAPQMF